MKLAQRFIALSLLGTLLGSPGWAEASRPMPEVVKKLTEMYGPAKLPQAVIPTQQKDPLGHLLALQRRHWAPAFISGTFYEWRTLSQYRRQAGLHLGYDIALPYGSAVSAGWPGTVVAVVPWTDTEWGVTVRGSDGTEVTYGHISPSVSVGTTVASGDVVGRIASDHVDVKMRDRLGRYVPFGEGSEGVPTAYPSVPKASRNSILTAWLVAKSSAEQADEDLFMAQNASKKWELEKRSAERTIQLLDHTLSQLKADETQGLISRKRLEEIKAERAQAKKSLDAVSQRKKTTPSQLKQNQQVSRANLTAIENWAKSEGLRWSDVEALIAKTVATDSNLQKRMKEKAQTASLSPTLAQLEKQRAVGAARLKQLEALYEAGGLSQQEIEDERLRQRLLDEEYNLTKRRKAR